MDRSASTFPLRLTGSFGGGYVDVLYLIEDAKGEDGSPLPLTLEAVRRGVEACAKAHPWLAGRVVDKEDPHYCPHPSLLLQARGGNNDGGAASTPLINVVDGGTLAETSVHDFGGGDYSAAGFQASASYTAMVDPEAILQGKFTRLADGVALSFTLHHDICDGHAAARVCGAIADFIRVGSSSATFNFSQAPLIEKFDLNATAYPGPRSVLRWADKANPLHVVDGAKFDGCQTFCIKLTAADMQTLKAAAQKRAMAHVGDLAVKNPVSSRDAMAGWLWQLHLIATYESNKAQGVPLTEASRVTLGVAADARPRLGVGPEVVGCANVLAMARDVSVGDALLKGAGPAWAIREAIMHHTPQLVAAVCGWAHHATGGGRLRDAVKNIEMDWCHGESRGGYGDSCCTDWSRGGWYGHAFTESGEAPLLVVPPNTPFPGFFRTTAGRDEGSFIAYLHAGGRQAEFLQKGGQLHHLLSDLELIGRHWDL